MCHGTSTGRHAPITACPIAPITHHVHVAARQALCLLAPGHNPPIARLVPSVAPPAQPATYHNLHTARHDPCTGHHASTAACPVETAPCPIPGVAHLVLPAACVAPLAVCHDMPTGHPIAPTGRPARLAMSIADPAHG